MTCGSEVQQPRVRGQGEARSIPMAAPVLSLVVSSQTVKVMFWYACDMREASSGMLLMGIPVTMGSPVARPVRREVDDRTGVVVPVRQTVKVTFSYACDMREASPGRLLMGIPVTMGSPVPRPVRLETDDRAGVVVFDWQEVVTTIVTVVTSWSVVSCAFRPAVTEETEGARRLGSREGRVIVTKTVLVLVDSPVHDVELLSSRLVTGLTQPVWVKPQLKEH